MIIFLCFKYRMNAEQIYDRFKMLGSAKTKAGRDFKATLSTIEYNAYKKYRDNLRKRKSEIKHKEENNAKRREYIRKVRAEQPDKYGEINRRNVQAFNERKKTQVKHLDEAREALNVSRGIIDDILNAVPNLKLVDGEVKKKRGRKVGWKKMA